MNYSKYLFILIAIVGTQLFAQHAKPSNFFEIDVRNNAKVPYTNKPIGDDNFQFVIVSDRTGGHRMGVFENAMHKTNLMQPEFVLSVGDLIEGYTEDKDEIERQWKELDSMVNGLESRFFYVVGNHDFSNQTMADIWKNRLGPDYYSFKYKNTLFLCLNSEDGILGPGLASLGEEQFNYFKKVLEDNKDVKWTFVLMHQPMWTYENTGKWEEMANLLKERKHTVFAGHVHQYTHFKRNNSDYIILGTTGGISGLKGKAFGEEDHITWVTVGNGEPVITNLMLDDIEDKEFVTEASAKLFKGFTQNPAVFFEPQYITKRDNVSEMKLILRNTQPYSLSVELEAKAHNALIPEKTKINVTIPSKTTKEILIPIKEIKKIDLDNLENPLIFDAKCSFANEDASYQNWRQQVKFFPNIKYNLESSKEKIVVDGNLNEWDTFPYVVKDTINNSNISFQFNAKYNEEGVFLGVKVKNHFPDNKGETSFSAMQGITLLADVNPKEESAFNTNDIAALLKGQYLILMLAPDEESGEMLSKEVFRKMLKSNRLYKDIALDYDARYIRTKDGYDAEFKIPTDIVKLLQGNNWNSARFNITLTYKAKDGSLKRLTWQPSWDQLIPGTGMFFKEL